MGTIVEDACLIVAAAKVPVENSYLAATGFGVECTHQLDHYACLENISTLIKDGVYKGDVSLTPDMADGASYIDLVNYLNERRPSHMSIVANPILSTMQDEFLYFHVTSRSAGSEKFVSSLMGFFWFFTLQGVVSRIAFASEVEKTETMYEVLKKFQLFYAKSKRRKHKKFHYGYIQI